MRTITDSQKPISYKKKVMASIFNKAPKQPDYKADLLNTETSILKRLNSFIDETTNKWKSNNDWIKKTGDQVNELLKRTFDLQRKVEGQIIDVENTAKKQFYNYDVKMDKFEERLDGKYTTVLEHNEKIDLVSGLYRDLNTKIEKLPTDIKSVERKIPTNVVKKDVLEDLVAELRTNITKVANAIPKNVASNELVSDIRREIIEMFQPYVTSDALKSVERKTKTEIGKVAKASAAASQESKKTLKEFNKLASKVNDIKDDYIPAKMIPQIRSEITNANLQLTDLVNEVENKIPTDYATQKEVDVLRELQRDITTKLENHKSEQSKEISTTMINIENFISRTSKSVDSKIKDFENTLAETTMGKDADFMKNIIREIADEEIKQMRNTNILFQENLKNTVVDLKNQNRNIASKINELQSGFDKLIKLTQTK